MLHFVIWQFKQRVSGKLPHDYMKQDIYLIRWLRGKKPTNIVLYKYLKVYLLCTKLSSGYKHLIGLICDFAAKNFNIELADTMLSEVSQQSDFLLNKFFCACIIYNKFII